jgi:MSHA pilin protein MshC
VFVTKQSQTIRRVNGFTLIELIVVIVVLGILSTFAVSRFQGRGGFAEYAYQARLISALRNMQQKAMQDVVNGGSNSLYRILVSTADSEFGPPVDGGNLTTISHLDESLSSLVGEISADNISISTEDANLAAGFNYIRFDAMGRPINDADPDNSCSTGCTINFIGEASATVCIESQGYVHRGSCG